jgi:hypothetical protein
LAKDFDVSKWHTDDIMDVNRKHVADQTENWSAEMLREKIAELLSVTLPFDMTLSPLTDASFYDGVSISSDLWPYQPPSASEDDVGEADTWGVTYGHEDREWHPVAVNFAQAKPEKLSPNDVSLPEGGVHESFDILKTWGSKSIASIFCGSFSADDVRRLVRARSLTPTQQG